MWGLERCENEGVCERQRIEVNVEAGNKGGILVSIALRPPCSFTYFLLATRCEPREYQTPRVIGRCGEEIPDRSGLLEKIGVCLSPFPPRGASRLQPLDDRHGPRLVLKGRDFEPYQRKYGPLPEERRSYGRWRLIQEWCVLLMRRPVCSISSTSTHCELLVAQQLSGRT